MGEATDAKLKVRGVNHLRIIGKCADPMIRVESSDIHADHCHLDASVFPSHVSCSTCAGLHATHILISGYRSPATSWPRHTLWRRRVLTS